MSGRPPCAVNELANLVVDQIRSHAEQHPELWHQVPATLERGVRASQFNAARPLVVIHVDSVEDPDGEGIAPQSIHRSTAVMMIACAVDQASDPEGQAHEIAADVRRALAANEAMVNRAGDALVNATWLWPRGYSVVVGIDDAGAGEAVAMMEYRLEFDWTHAAT